jgi:hypothetical protein
VGLVRFVVKFLIAKKGLKKKLKFGAEYAERFIGSDLVKEDKDDPSALILLCSSCPARTSYYQYRSY